MTTARVLLMYVVSFVVMFVITYVMVNEWGHVYPSLNKVYMAGLMVAAMGVVNSLVMGNMYANPRVRNIVLGLGILLTVGFLFLIRRQIGIGNEAFLQSMIPHHSSAILMCKQASVTIPEIVSLCDQIVETQEEEISQMTMLLEKKGSLR